MASCALAVILATGLAACGNASTALSKAGNAQGVTADSIAVGGVASLTGPLPDAFAPVFDGARAYLDMVDASGGINGRKIRWVAGLDDGSDPSQDSQQVRTLVESDHVFAVVGVGTPTFTGAQYLAQSDVPTFGYNVSADWWPSRKGDVSTASLFGYEGSYIDFSHPGPDAAFLAEQLGAKKVGLISYSITESATGCQGLAGTMHQFGIDVAFSDYAITAPAVDLSADVTRMRHDGVDFVVSCLDLAGNLVLARALQSAGMSGVTQYWLDGYDESALKSSDGLMNGVYFLSGHVPFESGVTQASKYPAMALYLAKLHKYFPADEPSEPSLAGWISAEMFCDGLRKIGRDVTRQRLIAAVNSFTSFTGGLVAPIDWKDGHTGSGPIDCNVFLKVENGQFVPIYGSSSTVFTCFENPQPPSHKVVRVAPPPGIPGQSASQ
ncbi:MAG: ABC transporter substrate-binding protein [Acidimicrobiales bacterium]